MNPEATITICGKEVKMLYCAAAETGYERLSGRPSDVFAATVLERDEDGNPTKIEPPKAMGDDYIKLAIAAIVSYYTSKQQPSPITGDDIMYNAGPAEVSLLISTIVQLRSKWYEVPEVVKPETDEAPSDSKNE